MPWNASVLDSQILAVHAALVPNGDEGEVVLFGGDEHWGAQQEPGGNFRKTRVYDVRTHTLVAAAVPSPDSDVFCSHHAFVGDGRLLIAGGTQKWPEGDAHGHALDFLGHRRCWLYNHRQRTWTEVARLNKNPAQPNEEHSGGRWYPGLVTTADGRVSAFFGHPDQMDMRHRNVLPERYDGAGNFWASMPKVMGTAGEPQSGGRRFLFFPRVYQIPNGRLFFATPMPANFGATEGTHFSAAYDPVSGDYLDPKIGEPDSAYHGWDRPAVLLPLLPAENYRVRMVFVGGVNPQRLDLGEASPAWSPTAARVAAVAGRDRRYANAVLLPTGEVCVVGGVADTGNENPSQGTVRPEDPVLQAEVYSPGIDWVAGTYANPDSWSLKESAVHARNYHSTALLLPNGKVWVAGGNFNGNSGDPGADITVSGVTKKRGTRNIELYEPDYIAAAGRIQITDSPKVLGYNQQFVVEIDRPATNVRHVALIRAGSVTHSTDNDQRFVGLAIVSRSGNTITLAAPPNGNVAPPGNYMLWVVDNTNIPCQLAPFVRLAHLSCRVVTDRSTFSREEVEALGGGGQATFNHAVYVKFDGFIHTELTGTPTFSVQWADNSAPVPGADFTLIPAGRLQEVNPGFPDIPQQITFPFHVRFLNLNAFAGFTDTRTMRVTFTLGHLTCSQVLDLTYNPNPYQIDINAAQNNPAWLSTDVRVFSIEAGQNKFGDVNQGADPIAFIRQCLDKLNNPANNGPALFQGLSESASLDLATNGPPPMSRPLFNYAIARVRYRATTTTAQKVKCFFRMFNVQATGLAFDAGTTYRRTPDGPNTVPLLGVAGGQIASIPFFATSRSQTVSDQPGAESMEGQDLTEPYDIRDIAPNPSGAEVSVFFGCWLDINRTDKRFPLDPGMGNGPWSEVSCRSIQELTRGRHMCIVSEIFFQGDPIMPGDTPDSSDNLAQRNLAILHSDNPGGPDSHTVMHTFEIMPSQVPVAHAMFTEVAFSRATGKQWFEDELMFRWHNLPAESEVTVYFSDIDTEEIRFLGALRQSPLAFEIVDKHTLRLKPAGATWIPIPGGRDVNIPALLSIKLPDTVVYGQEFRVTVHQMAGRSRKIVGSCEFVIPVSKAELIVDEEARTLSVFKHILTTIPTNDRWYPLMQRYVHHMGAKVDALGGNSVAIHPNPDGSGRPYEPRPAGSQPGDQRPPVDTDAKDRACCERVSRELRFIWLALILLAFVLAVLVLIVWLITR